VYQALWVTQSLVDQRTSDREAEAAAFRLARDIRRSRANGLRRTVRRLAYTVRVMGGSPAEPVAVSGQKMTDRGELVGSVGSTPTRH
jgi:hypothetical protein